MGSRRHNNNKKFLVETNQGQVYIEEAPELEYPFADRLMGDGTILSQLPGLCGPVGLLILFYCME